MDDFLKSIPWSMNLENAIYSENVLQKPPDHSQEIHLTEKVLYHSCSFTSLSSNKNLNVNGEF